MHKNNMGQIFLRSYADEFTVGYFFKLTDSLEFDIKR
jgi:hypothetical protein